MSAGRIRDSFALGDHLEAAQGQHAVIGDGFKVVGRMEAVLRGPDGEVKAHRVVDNLIVTVGKNSIMDQLLASPAVAKPTHMGVGTGTVDPALGDTALGTEIDRNALTSKTRSGNVITMVGNWAAGDATNAALTEAGVFNAASGGDMYARAEYAPINKGANDTLQITWTFTGG